MEESSRRFMIDRSPIEASTRCLACSHRWTRHYGIILDRVPPRQVLFVHTDDLVTRAGEIAAFLGIPELDLSDAKANVNDTPALAREDFDADYVSDQVELRCGDMMRRLGF